MPVSWDGLYFSPLTLDIHLRTIVLVRVSRHHGDDDGWPDHDRSERKSKITTPVLQKCQIQNKVCERLSRIACFMSSAARTNRRGNFKWRLTLVKKCNLAMKYSLVMMVGQSRSPYPWQSYRRNCWIDEVTATLPKMFETIFHMKNETLSASESEKVDETPSNLNKDLWNR